MKASEMFVLAYKAKAKNIVNFLLNQDIIDITKNSRALRESIEEGDVKMVSTILKYRGKRKQMFPLIVWDRLSVPQRFLQMIDNEDRIRRNEY